MEPRDITVRDETFWNRIMDLRDSTVRNETHGSRRADP